MNCNDQISKPTVDEEASICDPFVDIECVVVGSQMYPTISTVTDERLGDFLKKLVARITFLQQQINDLNNV